MARPVMVPILSGVQGWDGDVSDNFEVLFDNPLPIPQPAGLTESNLQSTFPAASYDRCVVWVNHSVVGYTLYWSDGTGWIPVLGIRSPKRESSATISQLRADAFVRFTGAGGVDYDFLTASAWAGRSVIVRNDSSGNVNLDPNASELINGVSSSLVLAATKTATIYSDGTELFAAIAN